MLRRALIARMLSAGALLWMLGDQAVADEAPVRSPAAVVTPSLETIALGVMTFNIRTSLGRDGVNVWSNRKALVAETIQHFSPQVIGLQEALHEQIRYLEEALPEYRWLGIDRGLNGGTGLSEATPIFYRYRELSPIESGNFWLSATPALPTRGRRPSRIVTWARFYHTESGAEVYVFNTHLTMRRGHRQVASVKQILARIDALPEAQTAILTGDFNSTAEVSETWRQATAGRLADAWKIANERVGPAVTWSGFAAPRNRENRIDWILVGGPVAVQSAQTVVYTDGTRYPSDHFPVYAQLAVTLPDSLMPAERSPVAGSAQLR